MATDLQDREDQSTDPIQHNYDQELDPLASSGNHDQDAETPQALQQSEEKGASLYNPRGDSGPNAETNQSGNNEPGGHLYNQGGDKDRGQFGKAARDKFASLKAAAGRNKLLVGGVAGGGTTILGIVLFLIIVAGALKIPNLAQNITIYQFARLTRQYAASSESITAEKAALDAIPTEANDSAWSSLKDKYTQTGGKVKDTWARLDKYRPEKVINNLKTENSLQFKYTTNKFGRTQLTGVTINDKEFIPVKRGYTRFVPGLNSVLDFKNNLALSNQVGPEVQAALRANEIGPIVRGAVAKDIRQRLGIGLVAWTLGSYENKDARQARIQNVKDLQKASENNLLADEPVTEPLKNAVEETVAAEEAVNASDDLIQQAIDKGGIAQSVKSTIGNALAKSGIETAIGVINPIYAVALPVCIVYDGSMESAQPTIDNQIKQQQATYYFIASAADQEKNGSPPGNGTTELATAVSGLNDNLGDVSKSNAITRAATGNVSTDNTLSAEASAGGNFTLLDALVGGPAATAIDHFGNTLCPVLTDTKVAVGIGVVSVVAAFFSDGASGAAETAGGRLAAEPAIAVTDKVATSLFSRAVGRTKDFVLDVGKSTAKVVGATVVAKLIVANKAHQVNSGLAQGTDLANIADAGGNLAAGEICRQGLYCRALTQSEIVESNQTDKTYLAYQNKSNSLYDRYLSTNNAGSLVSKMAMSIGDTSSRSLVQTVIHIAASLFNSAKLINIFANHISGVAEAEGLNTTYQNVQFGWSQSEEALINSSDTYKMLENQHQLDESGFEDAINQHYGTCFTSSMGTLLAGGDIIRNSDGQVVANQGLCSPDNLGPNNTDSQAGCGSSGCGDLVFRWRLAHRYVTVLNQLTGVQNAPASS